MPLALHGGDGHFHRLGVAGAEVLIPLLHHPDDGHANATKDNRLAKWIGPGHKFIRQLRADDAHVGEVVDVVLLNESPGHQVARDRAVVVLADARDLNARDFLIAKARLLTAHHDDAGHIKHFIGVGEDVFPVFFLDLRKATAALASAQAAGVVDDEDRVGAEFAELTIDIRLEPVLEQNDHRNRHDADDHAQHCQEGAHLVHAQHIHGDAATFEERTEAVLAAALEPGLRPRIDHHGGHRSFGHETQPSLVVAAAVAAVAVTAAAATT